MLPSVDVLPSVAAVLPVAALLLVAALPPLAAEWSPPVAALGRVVLRSVAPLGLLWVRRLVPVVMAPEPASGTAWMGQPLDFGRRAGMLTGFPSADSQSVR